MADVIFCADTFHKLLPQLINSFPSNGMHNHHVIWQKRYKPPAVATFSVLVRFENGTRNTNKKLRHDSVNNAQPRDFLREVFNIKETKGLDFGPATLKFNI
ncbi:MAG: hypothetical protein JRJ15_10745 [Deltaproteobacteria bacterium]|nr:hypothetical protein [Deltaproteobacteria bacterium]